MITMPYVNFAELSKERDDNHVEDNLPSTLYKNGDNITIKLKDGNILSGTFNGYWGEDNDDGLFIDDYAISDSEIVDIIRNDIDNQINEVLRLAGVQLNERENLTGFNRIAGFWNYAKEEFYFFPRTTEELDPNDDEIVQYIHNNPSKDYFTEHKVVRFGIENIPGEGVVCYIEGDTKSHAYDCYYTIIDEYQEEYDIIKYEVEYYVGNSKRMDEYDAYGNQIMESLNESVISEQVPEKLYYATFSKLLRKIKKCGYLGNSPYKSWSDSNNKYVYLSTDPDKAYSYAETALDDCDNERLYDMLEDDDIVILEIDAKYLDKNKLFRDENVVDGETTYQYKGIINCQIMKIYKPTLDESVENADILKNPTRNELKRYNVDKWRLLQDIDGNYYFADSFQYTHDMMSNKLRSIGISAVDANTDNCGIILYNALTNTFYYRLLDIIDYEDVEEEYKSSYLSKEFPNADLSQSYDDIEELDESVENTGIEQMNESVSSEFLGLIGLPIFTFLATIGVGILCKNRYKTVQQLKDRCEVVGVSKLDDKLIVKCKSDLPSDKSLSYYAGEKHLSGSTTIPIRTGNVTTFHNKKQYDKEYYVVVHYNNKNKEPTYIEFIPDGSWSEEKHKETIKLDDGKLKDKIESLLKEME